MMRGTMLIALLLATPAMAQQSPMAQQSLGWMKPGPGQEVTAIGCATCHSPGYIQMNSVFLTPDQWKAEVTKMRQVFGAPIDDDAAKQILDYLNANYAVPAKK